VRSSPHWISACVVVAGWLLTSAPLSAQPDDPAEDPGYRADALEPVQAAPPQEIQLVRAPGAPAWPEPPRPPEGAPNVLIWVLLPTAKRLGVLPRAPPSRRPKAQRN